MTGVVMGSGGGGGETQSAAISVAVWTTLAHWPVQLAASDSPGENTCSTRRIGSSMIRSPVDQQLRARIPPHRHDPDVKNLVRRADDPQIARLDAAATLDHERRRRGAGHPPLGPARHNP